MGEALLKSGHAAPARRSDDLLECDIVMAGGVTSGVVYPGAVAEIAQSYRFRAIGGASAGAIAAIVTAAAEYGRRTGANPRAFDQVPQIAARIGDRADDKRTRLFHLFTPEPATRAAFDLFVMLVTRPTCCARLRGVAFWALKRPPIVAPAAAVAIAGMITVAALCKVDAGLALIATALTIAAALFVAVVMTLLIVMWRLAPAVVANGYGLCRGAAAPSAAVDNADWPIESVTPWMHRAVQMCAGRAVTDHPLTFGDLWSAGRGKGEAGAERVIDLAMATSDVTRQRTAQLPFIETPSRLYVETKLLEDMFPASIARWMICRAGKCDPDDAVPDGLIRLPAAADLPIVFAARLSLSFPLLMSAVRMFTPNFASRPGADGLHVLRPVWFSDGGLTSNTPVHLFDAPIPSRPTFCINLVDYEAGDATAADPAKRPRAAERSADNRPRSVSGDLPPGHKVWEMVDLPRDNRAAPPPMVDFDGGLLSFAWSLINTARFWSDNQLLGAPGVRERVVDILLREDEGGLNFDMPPETLAELDLRGRAAGRLIARRYDHAATVDPKTGGPNRPAFVNHRWVRYRNLMGALEDFGWRLARARRKADAVAAADGQPTLEALILAPPPKLAYRIPVVARPHYLTATRMLEALALRHARATRRNPLLAFDRPRRPGKKRDPLGAAPRPKIRLRLRPVINNDPEAETAQPPTRSAATDAGA